MTMHSARRRSGLFGRPLNLNRAFAAGIAVIAGLLASFYLMLMVNMDSIDAKTEDLKEHPFAVTVAAGRAETLLMQVKTLDDRLAFARTPQTVASVKAEFESIDGELQEKLGIIAERHRGDSEKAKGLIGQYDEFRVQQQRLIELADGDAGDAEVERFLEQNIDPRIEAIYSDNLSIIEGASRSFDQLYDTAAETRARTIVTATVLMVAVIASFSLFVAIIRRKNRRQEQLQESLREALAAAQEANEAKTRFLSNVSHDIRTPLAAIIGFTDLTAEHVDDVDKVAESLARIRQSSNHLMNLVNDVLDMSKIESGQIDIGHAPFDMNGLLDMLASTVRPQADMKNLDFSIERRIAGQSMVVGDETRVSQILINLLGNAVKYTEPFGKVRLSVRELDSDEVELARASGAVAPCASAEDGGRLRAIRFVVEDNGIGMSEEFVKRIFEPFEREDSPKRFTVEGTGLGMSIAKSLVESMGGSIDIESEQGSGSRFTLTLPFEDYAEALHGAVREAASTPLLEAGAPDVPRVRAQGRADDGAWSHARVLLAEDDEIIGEIAEALIGCTGASVDRAWDGIEVLTLMERRPHGYYDLIFMDVQMPRMDGLEASRAIVDGCARVGCSHPPIIAMTANAYIEDRKRAFEAGIDGYAVKPIGKDEIFGLFERYVPLTEPEARVELELSLV